MNEQLQPGTRLVVDGEGNLIRDRRAESSKFRNILIGAVMLLLVVLAGLAVAIAIQQGNEREQQQHDTDLALFEIRESQRENCINGGNTLRGDIRREFVDLKQSILIPTFAAVAETLPDSVVAKSILAEAVGRMKARVRTIRHRIPDAECAVLYPLLDNPDTAENEKGT